jgi:aliphatic nitrilase
MSNHKRTVRAAAAQIAPDLDSEHGTVAKVCQAIAEAAAQGAQLVVFPETFVPYYPYFSFVRPPFASGRTPAALRAGRDGARSRDPGGIRSRTRAGTVVVLGVNERDHGTSTTRNWSSMPMAPG